MFMPKTFMNVNKRRIIMKAFIQPPLGYCLLVWMFHSWNLNNKINRMYEGALRITYIDKSSSFQDLLYKDNSVSIHHINVRNFEILEHEKFKKDFS